MNYQYLNFHKTCTLLLLTLVIKKISNLINQHSNTYKLLQILLVYLDIL